VKFTRIVRQNTHRVNLVTRSHAELWFWHTNPRDKTENSAADSDSRFTLVSPFRLIDSLKQLLRSCQTFTHIDSMLRRTRL